MKQFMIPENLLIVAIARLTTHGCNDVANDLGSLPELPSSETERSRPKALPDGVEIGSRVVAKNPQGGILHGWYQGYDPYTNDTNPHIVRRGEDNSIYECRKVAPYGSSLMPEDCDLSPAKSGIEILLEFVQEFADEPCEYGDNCPNFIKLNHGKCSNCRAREVIQNYTSTNSQEESDT